MIAFDEKDYGELVVHSPPLNVFCILMVPFTVFPIWMEWISRSFSYLIYWVENIIFLVFFFSLEVCLIPFVYLRLALTFLNSGEQGVEWREYFRNLGYFIFIGWLSILYIFCKDLFNMLYILSMHRGCKENDNSDKGDN